MLGKCWDSPCNDVSLVMSSDERDLSKYNKSKSYCENIESHRSLEAMKNYIKFLKILIETSYQRGPDNKPSIIRCLKIITEGLGTTNPTRTQGKYNIP